MQNKDQSKLIERARIMYSVINAKIYQKFVIPVKGLAKKDIEDFISKYKNDILFNDETGTLSINGNTHIPYTKNIISGSEIKNNTFFQKIKNMLTWKK